MDIKAELINFKPINLEDVIRLDEKMPDNIRNSIVLYNKAIENLRSGSEDIAVIGLKKAVSLNPNFNEAINLLGVCYYYAGETEKAAELFNKVIKAESNSVIAMNYLRKPGLENMAQIAPEPAVQPAKSFAKPTPKSPGQPSEPPKRARTGKGAKPENTGRKRLVHDIIKIGAGFVTGLLLTAAIYSPSRENRQAEPEPGQDAVNAAVNEAKVEYEKKYNELQNRYDLLEADREAAVRQADYYKAAIKLYEIESAARDRKYEEAADMLLLLKTVEYRDAELEKYNSLCGSVMPLAAKAAYDRAYRAYNSGKYADAAQAFGKVQMYDPAYNRMDAVLYYMGRSFQFLQDSRKAVAMFQRLLDAYPRSAYARSARVRINELTRMP